MYTKAANPRASFEKGLSLEPASLMALTPNSPPHTGLQICTACNPSGMLSQKGKLRLVLGPAISTIGTWTGGSPPLI